jgi:membrane-bound lytic murein transglycosylase A
MAGRAPADARFAPGLSCAVGAALLAAVSGCQDREMTPAEVVLRPVSFSDLAGWRDDAVSEALPAARAACEAILSGAADAPIGPDGLAGRTRDWRSPCAALLAVPPNDDTVRKTIEVLFVPLMVADGAEGLFTGYYEPELQGARERSAAYTVPIYRRPPDLTSGKPYLTRRDIEAGALAGRGLEVAWVADPIDAFFLQVQGSGRISLLDGSRIRVGYAANNGHPYTAIGRLLVERGKLTKDAATMQTVRQWLRDHPDQATALMQENARYIFFREVEGDGPIGSLGVALTPGRSLAVDASLLPLGAPIWLDTTYPPGTPEAGRPLRRLMVAQDTGGAIKGAVRGDIYWGSGETALQYAGPMKQQGRYYLLLPKAVADRIGKRL